MITDWVTPLDSCVAELKCWYFGSRLKNGVLETGPPAVNCGTRQHNDHVTRRLDHIPSILCPLDRSWHAQTPVHDKQQALCLPAGGPA